MPVTNDFRLNAYYYYNSSRARGTCTGTELAKLYLTLPYKIIIITIIIVIIMVNK